MIFRFLTSLKLTLTLLLGLAFVSIFGTVLKVEANRFEGFYQAGWFRFLLLLLALNIAACTWKTLRRNFGDRQRFLDRLGDCDETADDLSTAEQTLRASKFKVERQGGVLLASRGRVGRWGSTIVHISLLIVMIGGIAGEFGFVGTQFVPEGQGTTTCYDWDLEMDRPIGFELRVDRFRLEYYPIDLKFGVYNPETRELIREYVTTEGETVELPLEGLSAEVVDFEPFDKALTLDLYRNGQKIGSYRSLPGDSKEQQPPSFLDQFFVIKPMGFRDPMIRQFLADVSVLENGEVKIDKQRMMINHPLDYKGVRVFITAHNQDEFGFWSVGFQFTHDPGEWLVWTGSILLVLGLLCAFAIRYRVVGVISKNGQIKIEPLVGMNNPYGEELLARLGEKNATDD
ncbi:MAG: hypothetical protein C0615_07995 [Desulfuromonas sp.]|nr:MAG: hypothetical protein C0615_07995 [Desulfuromonas sp.]